MGVLRVAGTSHFSDSDASISAIGTAGNLAVQLRCEVDVMRDMAAWELGRVLEVGDLSSVARYTGSLYRDNSDNFTLYRDNQTYSSQMTVALTSLPSAGTEVVWYGHCGPADGSQQWLYDASDDSVIVSVDDSWSTSIGTSGSGNGYVRVGQGVVGSNLNAIDGDYDCVAVWTTNRSGASERVGEPGTGDTGIEHYVPWREDSGTTAEDLTGNSDHTISGATLVSGGTWNGPAAAGGSLPAIRRNRIAHLLGR